MSSAQNSDHTIRKRRSVVQENGVQNTFPEARSSEENITDHSGERIGSPS